MKKEGILIALTLCFVTVLVTVLVVLGIQGKARKSIAISKQKIENYEAYLKETHKEDDFREWEATQKTIKELISEKK